MYQDRGNYSFCVPSSFLLVHDYHRAEFIVRGVSSRDFDHAYSIGDRTADNCLADMNCGTCKHWGRAEIATQKEMHKHGFGRCAMREEGLQGYELSLAKVTFRGKSCTCAFSPARWESDKEEAA